MSNVIAFRTKPADWQLVGGFEWMHSVGFGPLDIEPDVHRNGPFDTEPGNPRDALYCLFCEGWGQVGQVMATDGEWTVERGPFELCRPCGGTGNGFEIGGSG